LVKIKLEDVKYFKSEANYIAVVLKDQKILTLMTLKDLGPKLPDFFQKVHRSYIVNLNSIDFIDNNAIEIGKDHIPISQRYEKDLLRKIELLN
jgi:DNA-binding LytR/AlgR family response regulator